MSPHGGDAAAYTTIGRRGIGDLSVVVKPPGSFDFSGSLRLMSGGHIHAMGVAVNDPRRRADSVGARGHHRGPLPRSDGRSRRMCTLGHADEATKPSVHLGDDGSAAVA